MALKMEVGRGVVGEVLGDRKAGLITVVELERKGGPESRVGVSSGVPAEEDAREVGGYMLGDKTLLRGGISR
jgi:hypothetical protein